MTTASAAGPQTALVVAFPSVDEVVARWRDALDPSARWGVPAHVTVMYPFLPLPSITAEVVQQLIAIASHTWAFDCTFGRCRWFGDDVLWLEPEPADEFRQLTAEVEAEFPGVRLYGGAYDTVTPHLTIGEAPDGDRGPLLAAERDLQSHLPLMGRVSELQLMAGSRDPGSWSVVAAFPLQDAAG